MAEDFIFKENVKNSFMKAREHMDTLESSIKAQKTEIQELKDMLKKLLDQKISNYNEFKQKEPSNSEITKSSTGNEGAYSFIHSFTKHSFTDYAQGLDKLEKGLKTLFLRLTKQEFLVFLTIYQLEDEMTHVSYSHIAKKLNLSEGCIRTYVSSIMKKGLPLTKQKINNRYITLHIDNEFRSMNLKQTLTNLFYEADPNQTKLLDKA